MFWGFLFLCFLYRIQVLYWTGSISKRTDSLSELVEDITVFLLVCQHLMCQLKPVVLREFYPSFSLVSPILCPLVLLFLLLSGPAPSIHKQHNLLRRIPFLRWSLIISTFFNRPRAWLLGFSAVGFAQPICTLALALNLGFRRAYWQHGSWRPFLPFCGWCGGLWFSTREMCDFPMFFWVFFEMLGWGAL